MCAVECALFGVYRVMLCDMFSIILIMLGVCVLACVALNASVCFVCDSLCVDVWFAFCLL